MVDKHIFILCGVARAGKDTVVKYMSEYNLRVNKLLIDHYSSIEPVKEMMELAGFPNEKSEKYRKMLAEVKSSMEKCDWLVTKLVYQKIYATLAFTNNVNIGITQYREVEGIEAFKKLHAERCEEPIKIHVIKVTSQVAENVCPDNHADRDTFNIKPDHIIRNDGSLGDLRLATEKLMRQIVG